MDVDSCYVGRSIGTSGGIRISSIHPSMEQSCWISMTWPYSSRWCMLAVSPRPHGGVECRQTAQADFFNVFRLELVAEFLAAHPKVRLQFLLSDERADLMEQGIDVAIRSG